MVIDELVAILGYDIQGEAEARRFEQSLDRLNSRVNAVASTIGSLAGAAAAAATAAFGALGKSVVTTSAEFEDYQAALETIEGSAEKASKSLDWISDFGKKTPYDVGQATEAFIALKAYGIDPIANDTLRVLGDTASAMNKPLRQAIEAFADATTFEFERLKEFGIRARQKGDEVTFFWSKNGKDLTKTVKRTASEIRKFMLETMGDRFSGAMLKKSKTWNGMMSNLGDSWVEFQRKVGEGGFFKTVKGYLADFLDYLGKLDEDGTLDRWSKNLSDAFAATAEGVKFFTSRIATHIGFLSKNFEKYEGPIKAFSLVLGFLVAKAFPLTTVFLFAALVVEDFLTYLEGGESVIGKFITKIQDLTGVSEGVAEAIAGLATAAVGGLGFAFLVAPLKMIKGFGRILFTGIIRLLPLIMGALAFLFTPLGLIIAIAGAGAALIAYFWDEIVSAWNRLPDKAKELFGQMKEWFLEIDWADLGYTIGSAIISAIGSTIQAGLGALGLDSLFEETSPPTAKGQPPTIKVGGGAKKSGSKPMAITDDAWAFKNELASKEWSNLQGNLNKMNSTNAGQAVVNDNSQDNRDQSVSVQVNQTVTQATDAGSAVSRVVEGAKSGASKLNQSRSQLRESPAQ